MNTGERKMIETITRKVSPRQKNETADIMRCFGWRLKSTQEINSKESHFEQQGDTLYSVTTSENYVKMLFERETTMPNYSKLVALENEYCAILRKRPDFSKWKFGGLIALGFFAAIFLAMPISAILPDLDFSILLLAGAIIPGYYVYMHNKRLKEYNLLCNKEFKRIFSTAKKLL